ncbi:hypothetical protein K440DRAFT_616445 [Wilcoxina mikolae CBS 423.85]|nr:hypothetical protein K440DRAFT_616445 [Wilcoxina mikolae CBS 423.85]
MHECKSSGGHFFLHSPQIRSFICHRCHTPFTNYNPPVPRTNSARQWYVGLLDKDRPKAPWRCIVETCVFTVCQPCSEYVQKVLRQIQESKEAAERDEMAFDIAAELEKVEVEGRVGTDVFKAGGANAEKKAEEDKWKEKEKRVSASFMMTDDDGDGKIEVDPMEVEVDDGDGEEYSIEFLKRTTTRSAAAAAAGAANRVRARRQTFARRDSTRRGAAAHDG